MRSSSSGPSARIHSLVFVLGLRLSIPDHGTIFFRFGVPVCPHAGGVGLCEYVIHLRWGVAFRFLSTETLAEVLWRLPKSLIDYIAVSGTMERNVLEYVDHLHEHFLYPCSINERGRYNVPSNPVEGYRLRYYVLRPREIRAYCPFSLSIASRCTSQASQSMSGRMGRTGQKQRQNNLEAIKKIVDVHTRCGAVVTREIYTVARPRIFLK